MSEAPSAHPSEDNVNCIVWFDFFSYFFLLKVFSSLNVRLYLKSSPSLHWKQQNVILQRHCLLKYNLYHTPVLFGLLCGESHWRSESFVSVESLEISLSCLWVTKQQRIHLWVICRYGSNSQYASKCAVLTEDNVQRPVWYFITRKNASVGYVWKIVHPALLKSHRGKHMNEAKHWPEARNLNVAIHYSDTWDQSFNTSTG